MDPAVEAISRRLKSDWQVLEGVHELLRSENVLVPANEERIVEFMQPDELRRTIDLALYASETKTSEELLELCRRVVRHSVKTNHGRFHNQLFGQMDPLGLAGAWITEALNTSAYTFEVAPVFSLIEAEIISTISRVIGFEHGDGIFAPGGAMSNMYAMVLARNKLLPSTKTRGAREFPPLALFVSEEAHYSFKKCAHWLGIGTDYVVTVRTDELGRMQAADLASKVTQARRDGQIPFFVNATAGTTVLGAFDDVERLADVCEAEKLWLHVDGCHGGSVVLSKAHRSLVRGLSRANSFAWDPHKALGTPLQCALFLTNERELLARCNHADAKYLFQQDKFYDVSFDTGNKSIQCGRKIDAFKLWTMLKARGLDGFGALVDHALKMAKLFAEKIAGRAGFRLVLPEYQYTNVCFWYVPRKLRGQPETPEWHAQLSAVAPQIKERMVRCGTMMVGYSPLTHRGVGNFLRMVFTCFPILDAPELDFLLDEIERLGETV